LKTCYNGYLSPRYFGFIYLLRRDRPVNLLLVGWHASAVTFPTPSGQYYKPITIVKVDSRAINKLETLLTDNARVIIYNRHMFIVQATGDIIFAQLACPLSGVIFVHIESNSPTCPQALLLTM
jgi:hypothetical protein